MYSRCALDARGQVWRSRRETQSCTDTRSAFEDTSHPSRTAIVIGKIEVSLGQQGIFSVQGRVTQRKIAFMRGEITNRIHAGVTGLNAFVETDLAPIRFRLHHHTPLFLLQR